MAEGQAIVAFGFIPFSKNQQIFFGFYLTPSGESTWNKLMDMCGATVSRGLSEAGGNDYTGPSSGCWGEALGLPANVPDGEFGSSLVGGGGTDAKDAQPWILKMQQNLNRLSAAYCSIPRVAEDGIAGETTAASVKEFQRIFGQKETGEADAETAEAIARECAALELGRSAADPNKARNMAMLMYMRKMLGR